MAFEGLGDKLGAVFKRLRSRGKLNEKDIKEVIVNFNSRKMRLIATEDGFYEGTTIIELDLHID